MTYKPLIRSFLLALALCGAAPVVQAQSMYGGASEGRNANMTKLDEPRPEGGWDGLAKVLEAVKPGVDTRLDPTASQITDHIEQLLNAGRNEEALKMIEARQQASRKIPGTDVQLMFQHARALAALKRPQEAEAIYAEMTTRFPELPEPWNNLAVLYAARGELNQAQDALNMALRADPNYAAARSNLGDIQLMITLRSYRQEAARGVPGMKEKAQELDKLLKDKSHS
ncbi:tetratricopeptide repeat protein [Bordetella holmesii]|uniref:Tetratricopeptide repeat protein n=2 Tax=Bordetella holmesii TaxID=35814 RepID=A0A158M5I3_9BORD|nr:tetratricopeptide repeat protein [Bordetella holmesii]AHV93932.1 TPR repeat family protein [Bordetella holmesii ATCC 51541]AIT24764.1 TPR repeat family protein [Bordetella holmesii 44057]EWM45330.1 TPR repeat family protein [Bordetella holmesii 70147]EWM48682.1 TPR repeat family protein [Bordetella holmesii 41130]EWM49449.1 TPR repeat family protein [Bordetella holmesii 35009]